MTTQTGSATAVPTLGLSPQALQSGPTEPVWDQESKDSARRAAAAVMELFARPGLSATAWANELAAVMTPKAITDFYGTDPARIPAHHVTGHPSLTVDPTNGFSVLATVATDAGSYRIQLLRTMAGAPWKANRITAEFGH
ncbi:hypothetical protein [Paenarthrobacter sp. Z7-10]|uniref:hypothetical protein n=1 Tax=Paenarthrobacter sp. Z7-10 TaxID=2787635 RepID=UPI0022A94350|nr:hypothetical protein [Paenarthrobacter sp. Z7-10]